MHPNPVSLRRPSSRNGSPNPGETPFAPLAISQNLPEETEHSKGLPFDSFPGPKRRLYVCVKVAVELMVAAALLVLTAPLMLLLVLIVKLTSAGPAIYSQTRLGHLGKPYRMCKLRTMEHNCESRTGAVWALKNDPRTTPVGRLLRLTHLDEVPQLWNVVRGEMSLIGPRPERPEIASHIENHIPKFRGRLRIRPGVTGLAQMRLPADSTLEGVRHKLAHDLYYIREVSLRMDLRIALCTACHFTMEALAGISKLLVQSSGEAAERGIDAIAFIPELEKQVAA